ncbi:hypothetical protein AVEN_183724-1, partial [Araneus ventricosus]
MLSGCSSPHPSSGDGEGKRVVLLSLQEKLRRKKKAISTLFFCRENFLQRRRAETLLKPPQVQRARSVISELKAGGGGERWLGAEGRRRPAARAGRDGRQPLGPRSAA